MKVAGEDRVETDPEAVATWVEAVAPGGRDPEIQVSLLVQPAVYACLYGYAQTAKFLISELCVSESESQLAIAGRQVLEQLGTRTHVGHTHYYDQSLV